jgi:hypothetical protein
MARIARTEFTARQIPIERPSTEAAANRRESFQAAGVPEARLAELSSPPVEFHQGGGTMTRLALSLFAALALTGGFANRSSAYEWDALGSEQDVYSSTTLLPLVAIGDCTGDSACDEACDDCGCGCIGNWHDNTYVFGGGDVYKSLGDRITNINGGTGGLTNSFGTVVGFNTGFGLGGSRIRGQVGASYGIYDFEGRLRLVPGEDEDEVEEQVFFTTGIYKRGDMLHDCDPISWGLVGDIFYADHWGVNANEIDLAQLRGIFGYALSEWTEVGVWGTFHVNDDRAAVTVAGAPGVLRPIRAMNQANAYVKRNTEFGADITGYVGVLDNATIGDWQFGLLGHAPISCNWSVYGNFNYVVPSAAAGPEGSGEEQFNISFGLAYYFGGKARSPSVTGQAGLPLLNVANNGSFLVTD